MNRLPENLAPAGPWLKSRVFDAADTYIRARAPLTTGPRGGRRRDSYISLNEDQVPSFVSRRLPDPTGSPLHVNYALEARHSHRRGLPLSLPCFMGSLTLIRDCVYIGHTHKTVGVQYQVHSLQNHLVRRIEGSDYRIPLTTDSPLPKPTVYPVPDVASTFPKRVAVTEAWQLINLLDPVFEPPEDLAGIGVAILGECPPPPPPSGGGSSGN